MRAALSTPAGAAEALMARLNAIAAEQVAQGVLLDRIVSLLEARRAPGSPDARDELLLLLVAQMLGDDSVQVVDVMRRAAVCPGL